MYKRFVLSMHRSIRSTRVPDFFYMDIDISDSLQIILIHVGKIYFLNRIIHNIFAPFGTTVQAVSKLWSTRCLVYKIPNGSLCGKFEEIFERLDLYYFEFFGFSFV